MAFMQPTSVDFWLDPLCPWSWLTAQWLQEVQRQAELEVRWGVMSLAILNEGNEIPPEWQPYVDMSWQAARAVEAARAEGDATAFVAFLNGLGERYHVEGRRDLDLVIKECLAVAGLPDVIADRALTTELDATVREAHDTAMALGGSDVGSPILAFDGPEGRVGFYGPILSRVPVGADAVTFFEATRTLALTPGFFELKRTRDEEPWLG